MSPAVLDESRGPGGLLAGDDRACPVLLGGECLAVSRGPLGRVGPHRPPRPRMLLGVPRRLGLEVGVVLDHATVLGGDGVDDLSVDERIAVPAEVGGQVDGCLGHPGADDEPQLCLVELLEVGCRQHPGIGDHDHVGQLMAFGELFDDRDDRWVSALLPS